MPPLPPNLSRAGIIRTTRGWNTSGLSRRSNTTRGLLSTRMPNKPYECSNEPYSYTLPPSTTRLAVPRHACALLRPQQCINPSLFDELSINGVSVGDLSQFVVDSSSDGNRIILGSPTIATAFDGTARVYDYNSDTELWTQVGSIMSRASLLYGIAVDISSSGNVVAVMNVSKEADVFAFTGGDWVQLGSTIVASDYVATPNSVQYKLSLDGTKVAVSIVKTPDIYVFSLTYDILTTDWVVDGIVGTPQITTTSTLTTCNINESNNAIIVKSEPAFGVTAIHRYEFSIGDNQWMPVGTTANVNATLTPTGNSSRGQDLAISADGVTIVIGSPALVDNDNYPAPGIFFIPTYIIVLHYNATTQTWSQKGQTISDESNPAGTVGRIVDISEDGNTIAWSEDQYGAPPYPQNPVLSSPTSVTVGQGRGRIAQYNATINRWVVNDSATTIGSELRELGTSYMSLSISRNGRQVIYGTGPVLANSKQITNPGLWPGVDLPPDPLPGYITILRES